MTALVTHADGLLGASVIRALRWEGHDVIAIVDSLSGSAWLEEDPGITRLPASQFRSGNNYVAVLGPDDVVFDTTPGAVAVAWQNGFVRLSAGTVIGPGEVQDSALGRWISEFLTTGRTRRAFGGTNLVDARDLALAMIASAAMKIKGEFSMPGPWVEYEEILNELKWLTGIDPRAGGSVEVAPGTPASRGENFGLTLRPFRETLADIVESQFATTRVAARVA